MKHQLGLVVLIVAMVVLAIACGETRPERGCQWFAELVDDVALSVTQPQRILDGVSGESVVENIDNPLFERLPGESAAENSTRMALDLGVSGLDGIRRQCDP